MSIYSRPETLDFIKLDGVTPGSYSNDLSIDNRADVKAWSQAIAQSGRRIWLTISWQLDQDYLDTWRQYSNAALTTTSSCEGSCRKLSHQLAPRRPAKYDDVGLRKTQPAPPLAGATWIPGRRQRKRRQALDTEADHAITIWAMANSPLYLGGDLTQLDALAKSAFTNDELLAVDQSGHPAIQKIGGFHPVWIADAGNGDLATSHNPTSHPSPTV